MTNVDKERLWQRLKELNPGERVSLADLSRPELEEMVYLQTDRAAVLKKHILKLMAHE